MSAPFYADTCARKYAKRIFAKTGNRELATQAYRRAFEIAFDRHIESIRL